MLIMILKYQISPFSINVLLRRKVIRIKILISQDELA